MEVLEFSVFHIPRLDFNIYSCRISTQSPTHKPNPNILNSMNQNNVNPQGKNQFWVSFNTIPSSISDIRNQRNDSDGNYDDISKNVHACMHLQLVHMLCLYIPFMFKFHFQNHSCKNVFKVNWDGEGGYSKVYA